MQLISELWELQGRCQIVAGRINHRFLANLPTASVKVLAKPGRPAVSVTT
jgi:hypothetical protein